MKVKYISQAPETVPGQLLLLPVLEGTLSSKANNKSALANLDAKLGGLLLRQARHEKFEGKASQIMLTFCDEKIAASQILLVGVGKQDKLNEESLREALTPALRKAKELRVNDLVIHLDELFEALDISAERLVELVTVCTGSINYVLNHSKTALAGHKAEKQFATLTVTGAKDKQSQASSGLSNGMAIVQALNHCRNLVNLPAEELYPLVLAKWAKGVADGSKSAIKVKLINKDKLKEMGAGAVLAVAQGSRHEPVLIDMQYTGDKRANAPVIGFIGKAVTFDSGGVNLKTADGMETMKRDMAGGATVIEALRAIADLGLPVNVRVIVAAAENMPSGSAYKPGDVLHSLLGLTIEVKNTDAEGRLTLADAIGYLRRSEKNLSCLIDLATLTGAIRQFGADIGAGAFSNNKEFMDNVLQASVLSGELMGELPMWKQIRAFNKSDIADLSNSGMGGAGATSAAWFLREFVMVSANGSDSKEGSNAGKEKAGDGKELPWVHLDIAGPSYRNKEMGIDPKHATAFGLRTLVELARILSSSPMGSGTASGRGSSLGKDSSRKNSSKSKAEDKRKSPKAKRAK